MTKTPKKKDYNANRELVAGSPGTAAKLEALAVLLTIDSSKRFNKRQALDLAVDEALAKYQGVKRDS